MFKLIIIITVTLYGKPVTANHVMDSGLTLEDCTAAMTSEEYRRPWITAVSCERH